ncbi:MAG: hypothetical protein ACOX0E_04695 [Syntrophomonadaceae bacterium]|jgi:hypothetical protein
MENELINMAGKKKELMEAFLRLTKEQRKAISEKNYDNVFYIINEKQSLIERSNLLDLELKNNGAIKNQELSGIFAEIQEIMAQAIAIDQENIQLLKEDRMEILEKLRDARKNRLTQNLYQGKNASIEGILLDKKE